MIDGRFLKIRRYGALVIILEGPDGGGKTTLANKLSIMTGYKIAHFSYPRTQDDIDRMYTMYVDALKSAGNVIFDRCWYSDMVYGPVMRDGATITYPQMFELERLAARRGAIVVYCTDSKTALWQRAMRRGEDYVTSKEKFDAICDGYDVLFKSPHIVPIMKYTFESIY